MKNLFRFVRLVVKTGDPMGTILISLGVIAFVVCLWVTFATLF